MQTLVTRPAAQAAEWVRQLQAQGIGAVSLPLIGIAPVTDPAPLVLAWSGLAEQRLVVFVSPNAASHFFACCPPGCAWPTTTWAGSPGPGTTRALMALGVPAAQIIEPAADAPQFDSESLWLPLARHNWRDARVLMVRGDGGRDWLADTLRRHGAHVSALAAYRRGAPVLGAAERALLAAALAEPAEFLWFFSSSEAITHLAAAGPRTVAVDWRLARAIATHPRIAETARGLGFGQVAEARPTLASVVGCIQSMAP